MKKGVAGVGEGGHKGVRKSGSSVMAVVPKVGSQGTPRCPEAFSGALNLEAGPLSSYGSTQNDVPDQAGPVGQEKPAAAD